MKRVLNCDLTDKHKYKIVFNSNKRTKKNNIFPGTSGK